MRKTNFSCSEPTLNSDFGLKPRSKSATRSSKVSGRSRQYVSLIKPPTGRGREPRTLCCTPPREGVGWSSGRAGREAQGGTSGRPEVAERGLPERQRGDR